MELLKEGEDFPFQTADAAQSDLDLDEVTLAAKNAFGIKYLFAWQRIVIANILDSALGLPEDTPLLQTEAPSGKDDIALQNTPASQTDAPVEEERIALQTAATEEDNTALQTTATREDNTALQTDAPAGKNNTASQTTAPVGKADIALQTDATALQTATTGEDDTAPQTATVTGEDDTTAMQNPPALQTTATREDDIALQTAATGKEDTAQQTTAATAEDDTALQTATTSEDATVSQTATTGEDDTALQTATTEEANTVLQTTATGEDNTASQTATTGEDDTALQTATEEGDTVLQNPPSLQTEAPVGKADIALQTATTAMQNTPASQTDAPVEEERIALQTTATEEDNTAPQTAMQNPPSLQTDAPVEEERIALQTDAPSEEDDTALQTATTEEKESTASQTTATGEDDTAPQTATTEEEDTAPQTTATREEDTALQTNAPVGKADIALQTDATTTEESLFYRGRQIVLLPTGAGKSLCFLTPALLLKGPTLVIYPLLALMADQKRRMDTGGIESVIFRGGQSPQEREENFAKIKKGAKIIIANPEVLQNKSIVKELAACKIQHIAIDEAHCVSEWGDSFRPAYLTLGKIIEELGCKTVTAFTATASPQVLDRVSQVLFGGQSHIVRSDADRSNIRYNVIYAAAKKRLAFRLAVTEQKPLLIFCGTRAKSEDMARELALYMGCDKVKFYHAGLEKAEKTATEEWFFNKSDAVLCCTCAYGMGVDKKDIKTVIHLESPPTAESYLQESGRIARDGSIGKAILLWNYSDHKKFSAYPKNSREYKMLLFAESSTCRRQVLLDALGAEQAVCSGCDVCERGGKAPFAYDLDLALSFITKNRKMYGYSQTQALLQSEFNKKDLALFGLRIWDQEDILTILSELKSRKLIKKCHWPWKGRLTNVKYVNTDKKKIQHKKKERPVTEAHLKIRRSFMFNRRKLVNKIIGKKKA